MKYIDYYCYSAKPVKYEPEVHPLDGVATVLFWAGVVWMSLLVIGIVVVGGVALSLSPVWIFR
jgi:hypothetical protein